MLVTYPSNMTTARHLEAAFLAVAAASERHKAALGRVKMAKFLYLADLASVQDGDEPESGITWHWLTYGPYNNVVPTVEARLVRAGLFEVDESPTSTGSEYRYTLTSAGRALEATELSEAFLDRIDFIIEQYASMGAQELAQTTYATAPMLLAQEIGRGVVLDLHADEIFEARATIAAAIERFGLVPDPEAARVSDETAAAMLEHYRELEPLRAAASTAQAHR
jgi:uncharacterized membrane protein